MTSTFGTQSRPESKALRSRSARRSRDMATARCLITRSVLATPLSGNGMPQAGNATEGVTVDLGVDGVTVELPAHANADATKWILGIEHQPGDFRYAVVRAHHAICEERSIRIDGKFHAEPHDPLAASNLVPTFDTSTFQFRTRTPTRWLEQCEQLGIVRTEIQDRLLVCPKCRSIPTTRGGCRACGSIHVESSRFIHHFACAHVDSIDQFESDESTTCPKCLTKDLVVGADFEYLPGPYLCRECDWSDKDLEYISRCMACGFEFPMHQGAEQEVIGYHVDRLEPLDLLAAH